MKTNKYKGIIEIVLAAVLWGIFPCFSRLLYAQGVGVIDAVAGRIYSAAIIFLIWGLKSKVFCSLKIKDILFLAGYGVASLLLTYIFYAVAVKHLSMAMSSMLLYTSPAVIIIMCRIFFKDPIGKVKLLALFLTFAGSFLVVKGYDFSSLKLNAIGIICGLLSSISYSLYTVIGRVALKKYDSATNSVVPALSIAVIMLLFLPPHKIAVPEASSLIYYIALGVIGSVLPYYLYIKGLEDGVDSGNAGILSNVEPVTATILGYLFFADNLVWPQVIGIIISLSGAFTASLNDRKMQKAVVK